MTERLSELNRWLSDGPGFKDFLITPASSDASFRSYYRIEGDGGSWIAMDAPPEKENCGPFVTIAGQLSALGLHVPDIIASDQEKGFLLLEDFGSIHYLDELNEGTVERLYGDALAALAVIQACGDRSVLPVYDKRMLMREMGLFEEWLLGRYLGLQLSDSERQMVESVFELLVKSALEQPQVCVLRDYHSRNLMITRSNNPGILDFQDAVSGPVTYDLVSLLKDCYIGWPRERVKRWVGGYFELARQSGILREEHEDRFLRWFDLMGVQRHLKAAGIFARLKVRDGKPGYLGDIPRTLGYISDLEQEYPEVGGLAALCQRVIDKLDP
ncbi:MAG: phosphotransferase [Gammaproteobacteria bacterium]|nr:phosphotransferase [Gammaproteobacteria bacterium]